VTLKILLVNSSYLPNIVAGAERVVQRLAEALVGRGHQVTVVTTQPNGSRTVRDMNGVRVHYVPVANVYPPFAGVDAGSVRKALWHLVDSYNPLMARAFGTILDDERPDVVNTHNLAGFSTAVMTAAKDRGLPLVHTLHDHYLLCARSSMFKRGRTCMRPCVGCRLYDFPRRVASARVDTVIGVSRFILEHHVQLGYFAAADKRVIYNGFDLDEAAAGGEHPQREVLRFGFLGQMRAIKGLHTLVQAFLAECSTEAELWIAGKGDPVYEAELRQVTAGLRNVRWLGFVKPYDLLGAIDVLVVPSLWNEPAGLVVIEAFSRSVPVLASNRGGIPELFAPETGWLFDPDEPGGLRRALRRCIEIGAELPALGQAARAQARRFELRGFVDGYLGTYADAVVRTRSLPAPNGMRS
jgi:glycosyltransferase involved in cell wall biosynthesis